MFDKSIKLLYFLGGYFVGMATFSYATRLSDLLADDDLLKICELCENVLLRDGSDLNVFKNKILENKIYGLHQYLHHGDRDIYATYLIFYQMNLLKNLSFPETEENLIINSFICALEHFNILINIINRSMTQFGLTEDEHNFLASLDYDELICKIRASRQDASQQSSESVDAQQSQPTKTSCTFL